MDKEDWIEMSLAEPDPYIDDDGFSKTVLRKLPARRERPEWLKAAILLSAAALSSFCALILLPDLQIIATVIEELVSFSVLDLSLLLPLTVVLAISALSWMIGNSWSRNCSHFCVQPVGKSAVAPPTVK